MKKYGEQAIEEAGSNWELWDAPAQEEVIYHSFPEFTCLCPRSGYPDFATIHMIEVPDRKVLELRMLKLWFNSFRSEYISHELAAEKIFTTLWNLLEPKALFILMQFTPRGNLKTYPAICRMAELQRESEYLFKNAIKELYASIF